MNPGFTTQIALPVFNEEAQLERHVRILLDFVEARVSSVQSVSIADNGSTDATWRIAQRLAARFRRVEATRVESPGRGAALRQAWAQARADVLVYMDIDLSTDLSALPGLIDAIASESAEVAVGSRHLSQSRVERCRRREILSRGYNLLLRSVLRWPLHDAQCGFKAVSRGAAQRLLPCVEDQAWFFDTELLWRAWQQGMTIREVPVVWKEDADSRVRLGQTVWRDLIGLARLRLSPVKSERPVRRRNAASAA